MMKKDKAIDNKGSEVGVFIGHHGVSLSNPLPLLMAFEQYEWAYLNSTHKESTLGFATAEGFTLHIQSPEPSVFDVSMGIEAPDFDELRISAKWKSVDHTKVRELINLYSQAEEKVIRDRLIEQRAA